MREEPEQPVKLPHLHNLGSPAYLELSGTMVGRAGLDLWRGSRLIVQKTTRSRKDETVSCHLPRPSVSYSRVEEDRSGSEERRRREVTSGRRHSAVLICP